MGAGASRFPASVEEARQQGFSEAEIEAHLARLPRHSGTGASDDGGGDGGGGDDDDQTVRVEVTGTAHLVSPNAQKRAEKVRVTWHMDTALILYLQATVAFFEGGSRGSPLLQGEQRGSR